MTKQHNRITNQHNKTQHNTPQHNIVMLQNNVTTQNSIVIYIITV